MTSVVGRPSGGPAQPGTRSCRRPPRPAQVTAQLDATQQSEVKVGDHVTITLPSDQTTPGVVTSVGTVATAPSPADPAAADRRRGLVGQLRAREHADHRGRRHPTDPSATGTLDQAPVQVTITTATVNNALVVPVDALLARERAVTRSKSPGGRRPPPGPGVAGAFRRRRRTGPGERPGALSRPAVSWCPKL